MSSGPHGECCDFCRFFAREEQQCRKNAPTVIIVPGVRSAISQQQGMQSVGVYPPTNANSWCGQFEQDPA
jgi:hypothetical protein